LAKEGEEGGEVGVEKHELNRVGIFTRFVVFLDKLCELAPIELKCIEVGEVSEDVEEEVYLPLKREEFSLLRWGWEDVTYRLRR
jgi:hypothetical protein